MYEARSAEYIQIIKFIKYIQFIRLFRSMNQIYESIVIEFFLWLKIHKIGTCVLQFALKNLNFYIQHGTPRNFSQSVSY